MSKKDCACCGSVTSRRAVLTGGALLGAAVAGAPIQALAQVEEASRRPQPGDFLVKDSDKSLTPLTPADLTLHSEQMWAWALSPEKVLRDGSGLNALILLKFEDGELAAETKERAAEGVVCYTQICTHNGCGVGDWVADDKTVVCACHHSQFDPKDSGKVLDGPAPRPLPALPLAVKDGKLVVAGAYSAPVGFDNA